MRWGREKDRDFLRTLPPDAPALVGMPELWADCELYMEAFRDLALARPLGMGAIGFIPVSEVIAWGMVAGVKDLETLWRHVHALDVVYVADFTEQQAKNADRAAKQR
jgi:hypothetical protein